jgi:hypothetical protein
MFSRSLKLAIDLRARDGRLLARDQAQLVHRRVQDLDVVLGRSNPHVHDDLRHAWDRHEAGVPELLHERGGDLLPVLLDQTRL